MNIGIDCIALPLNFSGAAYYISNLAKSLLQTERSFNIHIYCKSRHAGLFKNYLREGDSLFEIKIHNRLQQLFYYEKVLSKKLVKNRTDVFIATHYITPPQHQAYKLFTIFHDMGFILHREYYPFLKRKFFQYMMQTFIDRSDKIITVSQSTMKDLNHTFPGSLEKTIYIYPGTDHLLKQETTAKQFVQKNKPYILAVNSFEKRKNIPFIIDIFNTLKQQYKIPHTLYIVGRPDNGTKELYNKIKQSSFSEYIKTDQNVSFSTLINLYQNADLFINTSLYEGFGFTPLEAISLGCPAFIYSNAVSRELFNDHPCLIDSQDASKWAEKISSELENNFENKISYAILRELSWEKCALNFKNLLYSHLGITNVQRRLNDYYKSHTKLWQRSKGV